MPPEEMPGIADLVEIGVGGYGRVYRGYQAAFGRTVAVKVISGRLDDEATVRRFERECRTIGAVSGHPNIVAVHDAGTTAAGHPYIVMPYLQHGSLAARLASRGPLPWQQMVVLGVKLAGALETAHRVGVLHRDVKPENVLVSDFGEPLLADFGIASQAGVSSATTTGAVALTPAHGAPELLDGAPPSAASDVYSLASTLHCLVTGVPPFHRDGEESIIPLLQRTATEMPPDLRPLGVAPVVARAIDQAMAKDPRSRPVSAMRFGQLLQAAQQELGFAVTPLAVEGLDDHGPHSGVPAGPGPLSLTPSTGDHPPRPVQHTTSHPSQPVPMPAVPQPPMPQAPATQAPAMQAPSHRSTSHSAQAINRSQSVYPPAPSAVPRSGPAPQLPPPTGPRQLPSAAHEMPTPPSVSRTAKVLASLAAAVALVFAIGFVVVSYRGDGKPNATTSVSQSATATQTAKPQAAQLSSALLTAADYGQGYQRSTSTNAPLETLYCGKPVGLDTVESAFGSAMRPDPVTAAFQQLWRPGDQAAAKYAEVLASAKGCGRWKEEELEFVVTSLQPEGLGSDAVAFNTRVTGVPGLDELYVVQVWTLDGEVLDCLSFAFTQAPEGADLQHVFSVAQKARDKVRQNA